MGIPMGIASALWGQQTFDESTPITLQSLTVAGAADHATVAANRLGDLIVANHADHPQGGKLVEITIITARPNGRFQANAPIMVGDPTLGILGDDSCRKPDVVALDDASFAVCFPRGSSQNSQIGRLEIVLVKTRDQQDRLLAIPEILSPAPGRGFVIDTAVVPGDAGVMPDLVSLGSSHPRACAVVYASEIDRRVVNDDSFREYELKVAKIDFSYPLGTPGFLAGPSSVVHGIPMDNQDGNAYSGGLVLPDVVLDDSGNLAIAWEQYLLAPHQGLGAGAKGRVVLERRAGFDSATPLALLDRLEFAGKTDVHQQRRPNLAESDDSPFDGVALTWTDREPLGIRNRVEYQVIEFPNGGAPGVSPPMEGYWVDSPNLGDAHPIALLGADYGIAWAVRDYGFQREVLSSYSSLDGHRCMVPIDMGVAFPWRVATALLRVPPLWPWQRDKEYLVQVCEGDDVRSNQSYRIQVRIDRL